MELRSGYQRTSAGVLGALAKAASAGRHVFAQHANFEEPRWNPRFFANRSGPQGRFVSGAEPVNQKRMHQCHVAGLANQMIDQSI